MSKFVYLASLAHPRTWIKGGELEIKLASSYLSIERDAQRTPDETFTISGSHSMHQIAEWTGGIFDPNANYEGFYFENNKLNDHWLPDAYVDYQRRDDGLVLCMSNSLSAWIARKFRRNLCVEIFDIQKLKDALDKQIGGRSEMRECSYTLGANRGPFLKSMHDAWQDEFRLYWPNVSAPVTVTLPAGLGALAMIPFNDGPTPEERRRIEDLCVRSDAEQSSERANMSKTFPWDAFDKSG